ncbi:hypothetical protein NPS70_03200 [Streptomyces sp. C10-9-1]|uniref:hypothetical protein n=1 Tax=Streptomyces sp. C10-9-1 TaxID=1859285 RepID=UPI00211258AB|nr:hypothetical protein [Streptomyces sp. C10-9-1]MCQ6552211.1 hypothetical protein [Streptomyces sp. C10-9-1]
MADEIDARVRAEREKAADVPDDQGSGTRRLTWSRQQRSPGPLAWGFLVERVTRIELAL